MRDAIKAFEIVTASVTVPIILLFTKTDVLDENIRVIPFSSFFPEYHGPTDIPSICKYFDGTFRRRDRRPNRIIRTAFVNAADPDSFKEFFKMVKRFLLDYQCEAPDEPLSNTSTSAASPLQNATSAFQPHPQNEALRDSSYSNYTVDDDQTSFGGSAVTPSTSSSSSPTSAHSPVSLMPGQK